MTRTRWFAPLAAALVLAVGWEPADEVRLVGRASPPKVIAAAQSGGREFQLVAFTRPAPADHVSVSRSDVCYRLLAEGQTIGGQCGFLDFPVRAGQFTIFQTTSEDDQLVGGFAPSVVRWVRPSEPMGKRCFSRQPIPSLPRCISSLQSFLRGSTSRVARRLSMPTELYCKSTNSREILGI